MRKLALACVAACVAAPPVAVTPARADVYVASPPVYVYPRPLRPWRYAVVPAYYPPAYYGPVAAATPVCSVRVVRVWIDGRYVSRRVRHCY
jgi:hypothetical protein